MSPPLAARMQQAGRLLPVGAQGSKSTSAQQGHALALQAPAMGCNKSMQIGAEPRQGQALKTHHRRHALAMMACQGAVTLATVSRAPAMEPDVSRQTMTGPSSAAGRYSRRPVGLQGSSSSQPVLQMPQADKHNPGSRRMSGGEQVLRLKALWENCSQCERPHEANAARQASTEAMVTCHSSSGPSQPS